jgi:hypothetical protein
MFERSHHRHVITVLNHVRTDFFADIGAYFGGGTLLTLLYKEYRRSEDIDFICPVGEGYRKLRAEVFDKGYGAIFREISGITLPREIMADQYGVRFPVGVADIQIKFEIIVEARIKPGAPEFHAWTAVPCLNFMDACAEKLLSNSDRWTDSSTKSRDLIDLAVLRLESKIPGPAFSKAEAAYPVITPLIKALQNFQENASYRDKCFSALQVRNPDRARVIDGIDLLASDFGLPPTIRVK